MYHALHTQYLCQCTSIIITSVVSNPWLFIPAAILIVVLVILQQYYLRTSRDIKRLEAIG